jgi:flagellar biosynthesis protein FlhA
MTKGKRAAAVSAALPAGASPQALEPKEISWDDISPFDVIGLEVGYRLIPLVDKSQGDSLLARIKGVRKKLSQELGFLIPPVHIRDNLDLTPNAYRLSLLGVVAGQAEVYPERELAISPGQVFGTVPGIATKDPAFGLEAVWIEPAHREQAQTLGYTVVDASTVVATHLNQLLVNHAAELLGHEEVQQLLDRLAKSVPKLVEDLVKTVPLRVVVRVLQNLLMEQVPIRDMRTIAETLVEHAGISQDPAVLTAAVRIPLGRLITQNISHLNEELAVITLDPSLEQLLHQSTQRPGEGGMVLEPGLAERLHRSLMEATRKQEVNGQPAVLSVSPPLRPMLARFIRHSIPGLRVLAYNEIPDEKRIRIAAVVGR